METFEPDSQKSNAADEQPSNNPTNRTATVARDGDGNPIGAAVWLNADELAALGIDPDRTDAVDIQVTDGDLELTPAHGGDDGR